MLPGEFPQRLVVGLRRLQLSCGPLEDREGLGEQLLTFEVEEVVEARQDLVLFSVQHLQGVGDLALDVRDAPLSLQILPAVPVALLGEAPVLLEALQLGRDLGQPRGLRLEAVQLLFGGGEVGEVLLCLSAAVFGPAPLGLGLAQVAGQARVVAVAGLEGGPCLAGRGEVPFGGRVLLRDPLELGLEAAAGCAGCLELGLEGVEVGLGEAGFQDPRLRAEGVAVLAQEGLGGLDAADAKELRNLAHPAYALVVGEEAQLLLPRKEGSLEGGPVHPEQALLDPARHVGCPAHERPSCRVNRLGGRGPAPQAPAHGKGSSVGSERDLDSGRVLCRAAAPGDGLVGEAWSASPRAEKGPKDALEEGGLAGAVRPDDADSALGRIELQRVAQLLVVLDEETLEDHAALSGSSLAARAR